MSNDLDSVSEKPAPRRGAPLGNKYAVQGKILRDALRKALYKRVQDGTAKGRRKLDVLMDRIVDDAMEEATGANSAGISAARREVFDRIGGRPMQAHEVSGPGGGAVELTISKDEAGAL